MQLVEHERGFAIRFPFVSKKYMPWRHFFNKFFFLKNHLYLPPSWLRFQKWVFNSQFPTFRSLSHFQHPMKSQIIEDKHSILCFCEQVNQPFNMRGFFDLLPLEKCDFCKIWQIFGLFLVILASHNSPTNLQNTHIFGFAGTPSLSIMTLERIRQYRKTG